MKRYHVLSFILILFCAHSLIAATYYASPSGGGNGASVNSPFRVADFWVVAKPGDVLLLLDGKYTGGNSMLTPPQGLSGTAGDPITVKALNDGKVDIDGEYSRRPVYLYYNDYFVLEGFNAHSSNNAVVELSRSNHNIVRRVCAWDAGDVNTGNCFATHYGTHNLFEDCAGWGTSRKVFTNSQGGNNTIFRRCWGRWEGSTFTGPKMTYTFAYNSYNTIVENCIGNWNSKMSSVGQPYGIFSMDRNDGNNNANAKLLGCIAYVTKDEQFQPDYLYFVTKINAVEIENCVAFVEPGSHTAVKTVGLYPQNGGSASNLKAKNLTCIGGDEHFIDPSWNPENIHHSVDGSELIAAKGHILQNEKGANVMYRYENGVLTNKPLWPWPMNQRIIEAMKLSGRQPVDVTKTIFELSGGSFPGSNNSLKIKDIDFTEVGQRLPLNSLQKDTWYDLYVHFDTADLNWSNLAYTDVWVNTPFYTSGDSLNRGGHFLSADNYVVSLSIATPGVWVRQTEGSEEWSNISSTMGMYVDDDNSEYELNPTEGWAKVRIKLLLNADVGNWTLHAYAKSTEGTMSAIYSEKVSVEPQNNAPIAAIHPPTSPAGQGSLTVTLTTSTDVISVPSPLIFKDSQGVSGEVSLSGSVPGNTFTGTLVINDNYCDGIAKFSLSPNSLTDLQGNKGSDILSGKYILLDTTPPSKPINLTGEFR